GISKPKNYSETAVKDVVDELDYDKSEVILVTKEEAEAEQNVTSESETASVSTVLEGMNTDKTEADIGSSEAVVDKDADKTEEVTQSEEVVQPEEENTSETENSEAEVSDDNKAEDETSKQPVKADGKIDENETDDKDVSSDDLYYKNEVATEEFPNIIVIQLESIFDTKYMKDFYASENPMPFLAKLKRKYSSGLFTVPAVGAGTANTEFEVQTGMSTQFFGAGEYPFKTVMKDVSCDSMAYDLKRFGYATTGFHNNDATFYERYIDYSNLGFDVFAGMEHMYGLNYTPRGWAKDDVLDDLMIERIKQTEGRDYITTITVQGHGRYPKKHTNTLTDLDCYFTGQYAGDSAKQAAWEYYINMCKECDNMLENLVEKLERLDEPTVLFMYGDHLPSLELQETDLDGITLYETEWVMWDNIGLRKEKKDLKAYQASTYIFNRLGLKGGLMQNFHNKYMESENQEDYLKKLELLQYDTLYGNNYAFDGKNPFPQTNMIMGIRDITVDRYEIKGNWVWIYGKNFNEFSIVQIDGKEVDTIYVDGNTLAIALDDFEGAKEIIAAQVGDDHIVLSKTEPFVVEEEKELETTEEMTTKESPSDGETVGK
ncbi:MAG: LTA synthase family protein, partial [Clostridiales bacterium]|nr:LTA synthase family protein [Clostridiales bacterium]